MPNTMSTTAFVCAMLGISLVNFSALLALGTAVAKHFLDGHVERGFKVLTGLLVIAATYGELLLAPVLPTPSGAQSFALKAVTGGGALLGIMGAILYVNRRTAA